MGKSWHFWVLLFTEFARLPLCELVISFTKEPLDSIVVDGTSHQIDCSATISTPLNIVVLWKHNNTWIVDFRDKNFKQSVDGSLVFTPFISQNQGFYQCSVVAFDAAGQKRDQVLSRVATAKLAYIDLTFILSPEAKSAVSGSTIYLQCVSPASLPVAVISWEKDGVMLKGYRNYSMIVGNSASATLEIGLLSLQDIGFYRCSACNPLLKRSCILSDPAQVTLDAVQDSPYFHVRPSSKMAIRSKPVAIDCVIFGVPRPRVEWFHNSLPVYNSSERFVFPNGTIFISSAGESDSGSYVCTGTNMLGTIISHPDAILTVAFIDYAFVANPSNTSAVVGQNVDLACSPPNSYPSTVDINWYHDFHLVETGKRLVVSLSGTLRVANISSDDAGTYFCTAHNPITRETRTSKKAFLFVQIPPRLAESFKSLVLLVGQSLNLSCSASGSPSPEIFIYRNDQLVALNAVYYVSSANLTHAGRYSCVAENAAGNDKRFITVGIYDVPTITKAPLNLTIARGGTIRLDCEADGTPAPKIDWYFSPDAARAGHRINATEQHLNSSFGIVISNSSKLNQGLYICLAWSPGGMVNRTAYVHILVSPVLEVPMSTNVTVKSSETITLVCRAYSDPLPELVWFGPESSIISGQRFSVSTHSYYTNLMWLVTSTLVIRNSAYHDRGNYVCNSSNHLGTSFLEYEVAVLVPPTINVFSVPANVHLGESFLINCSVFGFPEPEIVLKHNDSIICAESCTSGITIPNAAASRRGRFECQAKNSVGSASLTQYLVVQEPPYPPVMNDVAYSNASSIQLSWKEPFDGYSPVIGYFLEMRKPSFPAWQDFNGNPLSVTQATVTGLSAYTRYSFRVRAWNEVGWGHYGPVLDATTKEAFPSLPPRDINASSQNSSSILVTWTMPEQWSVNGHLLGYEVVLSLHPARELVSSGVVNSTFFLLTGLLAYTQYAVTVAAFNSVGVGPRSEAAVVRTDEGVPTGSPSVISFASVPPFSLRVSYLPPPSVSVNGLLKGYKIFLSNGDDDQSFIKSFLANTTDYLITNLKPYTVYSVQVAVFNSAGYGPQSSRHYATTEEGVPGPVSRLTATSVSKETVFVSWEAPLELNGILIGYLANFTVAYRNESTNGFSTLPSWQKNSTFTNVTTGAVLHLCLAARTSVGVGSFVRLAFNHSGDSLSTDRPHTRSASGSSRNALLDWLQRQHLAVIFGLSTLICLLLFSLVLVMLRRRSKQRNTRKSADENSAWKLHPYYTGQIAFGISHEMARMGRKSCYENEDDLIWDETDVFEDRFKGQEAENHDLVREQKPVANVYTIIDDERHSSERNHLPNVRFKGVVDVKDCSFTDSNYSSIGSNTAGDVDI